MRSKNLARAAGALCKIEDVRLGTFGSFGLEVDQFVTDQDEQ